ncbi:MAG: hypothetical protein WBP93_20980 [Pyrinomonadaceae bacterium]
MNEKNSVKGHSMLRQEEASQIMVEESDPITSHLMEMASAVIVNRALRGESGPIADFDLLFFMEVMREFCSQHEVLKTILAGRGDELIWSSKE